MIDLRVNRRNSESHLVGSSSGFSASLVAWQKIYGRKNLPWQNTRDPYRVWISEVMLQQTQVSAVIEYYERFIEIYPDVFRLSRATLSDVLHLWSGLGYYSRARNLLISANIVSKDFLGNFPSTSLGLMGLPGVGPSTAAAIAAFCYGERVSIFDGNVRRVVARYFGYSEDLSSARNLRVLHEFANELLPSPPVSAEDMASYTQGLMDLGSLVCKPKKTSCQTCPVRLGCHARSTESPLEFPVKTRKVRRRSVVWYMWIFRRNDGRIWLEKRPESGIWAGLHSFPITDDASLPLLIPSPVVHQCGSFSHILTHLDIEIHYSLISLSDPEDFGGYFSLPGVWVDGAELPNIGIAQPILKIIDSIL